MALPQPPRLRRCHPYRCQDVARTVSPLPQLGLGLGLAVAWAVAVVLAVVLARALMVRRVPLLTRGQIRVSRKTQRQKRRPEVCAMQRP